MGRLLSTGNDRLHGEETEPHVLRCLLTELEIAKSELHQGDRAGQPERDC